MTRVRQKTLTFQFQGGPLYPSSQCTYGTLETAHTLNLNDISTNALIKPVAQAVSAGGAVALQQTVKTTNPDG